MANLGLHTLVGVLRVFEFWPSSPGYTSDDLVLEYKVVF